jgi:hypothetical protein
MAGCAAALGWLIALAAAANDAPAPETPPSEELLRYLAEFGDADDRWIDPTTITTDEAAAPADAVDDPETDEPKTDADDVPPDRPR